MNWSVLSVEMGLTAVYGPALLMLALCLKLEEHEEAELS